MHPALPSDAAALCAIWQPCIAASGAGCAEAPVADVGDGQLMPAEDAPA